MEITIMLRELADARGKKDDTQTRVLEKFKLVEATPEWKDYVSEKEKFSFLGDKIDALERELRILLNLHFTQDETGNKKPFPGTEIKEFSIVKVLDEKKALVWASQNAPSILKLDQVKFKKAVENLELDFVEKGVEYRAQIASDLSEYLK